MATFTSWTAIANDLRDAIASGEIERFFKTRIENQRQMQSSWDTMGMLKFYEFAQEKATREVCGFDEGALLFNVMGGDG